jgi:4-amino-4-deoxy-L-arabinose transferase-like glycosyltransferase
MLLATCKSAIQNLAIDPSETLRFIIHQGTASRNLSNILSVRGAVKFQFFAVWYQFERPANSTMNVYRRVGAIAPRQFVLLLIAVTAVLRVVVDSAVGFGNDEAYMVSNARDLALSYVDHPPLHVWLVGVWAKLIGSENPLLLRLPFVALFAGTTWLMFRLTEQLFDERAGLWAAIALNLAPVLTLAHASWVLPDGPLLFFLLAAANILVCIFFGPEPKHPVWLWIAAGICGGLALLSKYHGAFLPLAVFVFVASTAGQRRWLATAGPWLGALAGVVLFAPVIAWNMQHAAIGWEFQTSRLSETWTLRWLPQVVGGQILFLSPWLFVPLAWLLGRALWRGPAEPKGWFLSLLAIGPIAVFTLISFRTRGLPHWEMPGWLFVFPLLGAWVGSLPERIRRFARWGNALAASLLVMFAGVTAMQAATGLVVRMLPIVKSDPTLDLLNWTELGPALAHRQLIDAQTPALAAVRWYEAGKVDYAVGPGIPVLCICAEAQQFTYRHNPADFRGRNLILIGTEKTKYTVGALAPRFKSWEQLPPVILHQHGEPALHLILFHGVGFRG